jgi:hypothetical protein
VLLCSRPAGFLGGFSVHILILTQPELRQRVRCLVSLVLESKVIHKALAGVLGDQRFDDLPISLLLLGGSICGSGFTDAPQVTLLQSILKGLGGFANGLIDLERSDLNCRSAAALLGQANRNNPASEAERSAARSLKPLGSFGQRKARHLGLRLRLRKEVLAIKSLVLIGNGLGSISASVLNGLDGDSAVEGGSGEEVGIVGVPASLEGPVRDHGEFAIGVAGLWVPA